VSADWAFQQSTVDADLLYAGREHILRWEGGRGELSRSEQARVQGLDALGRWGGRSLSNAVPPCNDLLG
jgi:hypothetical protein